jgi:polar amino acid transport system substrate-binding protein
MRRTLAPALVVVISLVAVACSGAASPTSSSSGALSTASLGAASAPPSGSSASATTASTPLPSLSVSLPSAIQQQGHINVGVKCDYPPYGFIDANGNMVGYDNDIVHRLAQYAFGKPDAVQFQCVTSSNRIPFLTTGKIDLIAATMNWTAERAQVVAFTQPYFASGILLLVPTTSSIQDEKDTAGKVVSVLKGGTESIWYTQCMPNVQQLQFDSVAEALDALKAGRAVAFAEDDALLTGLAAKDPTLKVVGHSVAISPWGMAVQLQNKPFLDWVNAAFTQMRQDDYFWQDFVKWIPDPALETVLASHVPRPNNDIQYPTGSIYHC